MSSNPGDVCFVQIAEYYNEQEALVAASVLEAEDIYSRLDSDNCGGARPFLNTGMGFHRLYVAEKDAEKALSVLEAVPKE